PCFDLGFVGCLHKLDLPSQSFSKIITKKTTACFFMAGKPASVRTEDAITILTIARLYSTSRFRKINERTALINIETPRKS
ncbi:MAG: hypothetical protein ACYSSN_09935, partial [Planctomycetota bacterium]